MEGSSASVESINYKFVDPVPDKFVCSICTDILCDPHLTGCCGQHFCHECLSSWLSTHPHRRTTCPHCRTRGFPHMEDKSIKREINQLKVRCSHHSEGCAWVGDLGNLQTHLDSKEGCDHVEVKCPNKCIREIAFDPFWGYKSSVTTVRRKDLMEHLMVCDLRTVTCEHCGRKDTYWNMTGQCTCSDIKLYFTSDEHYSKCPFFPLDCPNGCSLRNIKRWYMSTHCQHCPLEPVPCPFREAGCDVALVRRDVEQHLMTQAQQHLLMTCSSMCLLRQRCDGLESRCSALEQRNTELEGLLAEHSDSSPGGH